MSFFRKITAALAVASIAASMAVAPALAVDEDDITVYSDSTSHITDAVEKTDYKFENNVARAMTVKGLEWIVENYSENKESGAATTFILDWAQTFTIPENVVIELPATLGTGSNNSKGQNPTINGGVIKAANDDVKPLIAIGKNFKITIGGSVTLEGTGKQVGIMGTSDGERVGVTVKENAKLTNFTTAIQHNVSYDSEDKGSWVYIEGGIFENNATDINMKKSGSKIKISGGVFKDTLTISNAAHKDSAITGGTFLPGVTFPVVPTGIVTFDVSKVTDNTTLAFLPEDTTIDPSLIAVTNGNSDATYPVTVENNVVKVDIVDSAVAVADGTRYSDLSEAIKAANGSEVKVIKDCTLAGYNPKMNVTLTADTPVVISGDDPNYLLYSRTTKVSGPITLKNTNTDGYALSIDWKDYSATLDGITIDAASGKAIKANCAYSFTIKGNASINGSVTLARIDARDNAKIILTDYTGAEPIKLVMSNDLRKALTDDPTKLGKVVVEGSNYTFADDTYYIDADGKIQLKPTFDATKAADFSASEAQENADAEVWTADVPVSEAGEIKAATWNITVEDSENPGVGTETRKKSAEVPNAVDSYYKFGVIIYNLDANRQVQGVSVTVEQ